MSAPLDPSHTAFLVMDYQNAHVERMADGHALVDRVNGALADARTRGAQVGWIRGGLTDAEFDAVPATSVMARFRTPDGRRALHADAPSTQIHGGFAPRPEDIRVRKTRVGAFTTTRLDDELRARGVSALVLAGISTSGVVLSTVREAMERDYLIVVLRDGCADSDAETHDFLTSRLLPKFTTVVDRAGLVRLWG